jgi:hypothetical protein
MTGWSDHVLWLVYTHAMSDGGVPRVIMSEEEMAALADGAIKDLADRLALLQSSDREVVDPEVFQRVLALLSHAIDRQATSLIERADLSPDGPDL